MLLAVPLNTGVDQLRLLRSSAADKQRRSEQVSRRCTRPIAPRSRRSSQRIP
jgi:hypothetical protein